MVSLRRKLYDRATTAGIAVLAVGLGACVYGVWRSPPPTTSRSVPVVARAHVQDQRVTEADLAAIGAVPVAPIARTDAKPSPEKPPLKLRGIICGEADGSVIFVEAGDKTVLCRVGDTVDGWTLDLILPAAARFTRAGQQLTLNVERRPYADNGASSSRSSADAVPSARPVVARTPASSAGQPAVGQPASSGRSDRSARTAATPAASAAVRAVLPRDVVDKARQDPSAAMEGVKYDFATGSQGGIVLNAVPVQSLAARCGLAPGDRIVAVNGENIDSPSRALELYARYRNNAKVVVTIERQGKRRDVEFSAQ